MGGLIERIKAWWENSTATQRYTTLGGIALAVLLMVGIFSFASKPRYAMLYGGLSQADQASIVTEIQTLGIPVKYDIPGNIEVPEDKIAELRMKLVSTGKVPKGAHFGLENLSQMTLTDTPAVERERLKAIAEGELARSIESNPAVRSARVHITLGDPSPFIEQQRPPSAAISLITAGATSLKGDSARGIAMLVANSIDGMELKNVVVLDENSKPLFDGKQLENSDKAATQKIELEQSIAKDEEIRLQSNLDMIFGAGNTKVSVRCEVDLDEVKKVTNSKTFGKGVDIKKMTEKMGGGASATQAAGMTSNQGTQAPATPDNNGDGNYESKVTQTEPNVTEINEVRNPSAGSMKSMMINVAANTAGVKAADGEDVEAKRAEFVQKVNEFVQAEIATKTATDGANFQAKVTAVEFDNTAQNVVSRSQEDAASAARLQQLMSMLPIAALLIVGVMVVRQLGKMTGEKMTQVVTPDGKVIQVPLVNGQIPMSYAMVQEPEHSTSIEPYEESPRLDAAALQHGMDSGRFSVNAEGGIVFHDEEEVLEVKKIREKKSASLAAIKQMAVDRPEATAMLIKSWLSEDEKYQR
jgi:flagellar M-ring protein FliF